MRGIYCIGRKGCMRYKGCKGERVKGYKVQGYKVQGGKGDFYHIYLIHQLY